MHLNHSRKVAKKEKGWPELMKKYKIKLDRRSFLKKSGMLGMASLAPGVMLQELAHSRAPDEPASSKNRWGLLIDANQCSEKCDACVTYVMKSMA